MNQKIFTYRNKEKEVTTYLIDNDIWLSQKDIAVLFNVSQSAISKKCHILQKKNVEIYSKRNISTLTKPLTLYSSKTVIEIGKLLGSFDVLDFESWVNQTLINQNNSDYQIVRYNQENINLDIKVSPLERTIWVTQDQLEIIFESSKSNISERISDIYDDFELDKGATVRIFRTVQIENGRPVSRNIIHYNLDLVISLGFRINSQKAIEFRRWANSILKSYMLNGRVDRNNYSISQNNEIFLLTRTMKSLEDDIVDLKGRVNVLENHPVNYDGLIIKDGEIFDAPYLISELLKKAKESIILEDPYVDLKTLNVLKNKPKDISLIIYTSSTYKLSEIDISNFRKQYGKIDIRINNDFHDRYLIIDHQIIYHLGTSLNFIGNKISQIDEVKNIKTIEFLLSELKE